MMAASRQLRRGEQWEQRFIAATIVGVQPDVGSLQAMGVPVLHAAAAESDFCTSYSTWP